MKKDNGQLNNYLGENGEIDVSRVVLITAINTSYRLFLAGVLIVVLVFGMFPHAALRFYESVGLLDRALYMANVHVRRESKRDTSAFSKYADGLYYRMMLAEELYIEGASKKADKYLNDIYESTYLYSTIEGIDERNARIDANNIASLPPVAHANAYSFTERVSILNYFAGLRLGEDSKFLLIDKLYDLHTILGDLSLSLSMVGNNEEITLKYCIFFAQIAEYIKYSISQEMYDFELLAQDDYLLMDKMEIYLDTLESYATFKSINSLKDSLNQIYIYRTVARLYEYMLEAASLLDYRVEVWEQLRLSEIGGSQQTAWEYYFNELLPTYVQLAST